MEWVGEREGNESEVKRIEGLRRKGREEKSRKEEETELKRYIYEYMYQTWGSTFYELQALPSQIQSGVKDRFEGQGWELCTSDLQRRTQVVDKVPEISVIEPVKKRGK